MRETVDFTAEYIVATPERVLDSAWELEDDIKLLRRGMWTATVEPCREGEDGRWHHKTDAPTVWHAQVNGFMVLAEPPIETGGTMTFLCYHDSEESAQRLAQRALVLYDERLRAKVEQDKDARIAALERLVSAQDEQIEDQYSRLKRWAAKLDAASVKSPDR